MELATWAAGNRICPPLFVIVPVKVGDAVGALAFSCVWMSDERLSR